MFGFSVFSFLKGSWIPFASNRWILQVGQNHLPRERERNRDWIKALMNSSFGYCDDHHDLRSNEKNVFCIDCAVRLCRHCKEAHSLHRRFQIYKYSYQDVFRHSELQKYFDCSKIQVLSSFSQDCIEFIIDVDWFSTWLKSIEFLDINLICCWYMVLDLCWSDWWWPTLNFLMLSYMK